MTDATSNAQKRPNAPFFGTVGGSSFFILNPPPDRPDGHVLEQQVAVNLGSRYEPPAPERRKYSFQLEPRYFNLDMRFPGPFRKPQFFSITTGVGFRFSFADDRFGLVPWMQAGIVRRNFSVERRVPGPEAGVDSDAPPPDPNECEQASQDNPFGGDCSEDARPLVPVRVQEYRTGLDLIVGINASLQVLKGRKRRDLFAINFLGQDRVQYVPGEFGSLRSSIRLFAGASTGFHPKVAPFLSVGFMAGPEINIVEKSVAALFLIPIRINFDVTPRGF